MLFSLTDTGAMSSTKDKQVAAVKMPPHSIDAEQSVLGGLMLDNDAWDRVAEKVVEQDFYLRAHRFIFAAMSRLAESSHPIDIITVSEDLEANQQLDDVGGFAYLGEIAKNTPSAANILAYADIVRERAVVRDMISVAHDIADAGYDTQGRTSAELLDFAETKVFKIAEQRANANEGPEPINAILAKTIEKIDELFRSPHDGVTGVSTGYVDLDKMTNGMQPSDLIIVAARPSMGKTAFVLSVLRNAAVDHSRPVAIFSLEMSAVQLVNRLISSEAELDSEKIKKGTLADHEWAQLVHKTAKLSKAPLFVDDTPALSILELRAKCRKLKAQHDIQMVVIDYLQLMSGDTKGGGGGNREQEIASISRALKKIAKELSIPVIALSQLSRAVETRGGDKRPQLSDLRESGAIEQDADMVMFLYRPEYYGITEDEGGGSTAGVGEVIIAKHRNGSLENVKLRFIGQYTKFTDLDSGINYPGNQAGEVSYSHKFTSSASGVSSFESGQMIKLSSKANGDDIDSVFDGGNDPAPF